MGLRQSCETVRTLSDYRTARRLKLTLASKDNQDDNQSELDDFVENAYLCEVVEVRPKVVDKLRRSERDTQFDHSPTPDIGSDGDDTDDESDTGDEQCDRGFLDTQPQVNCTGDSSQEQADEV
jgi:hypothetical protein